MTPTEDQSSQPASTHNPIIILLCEIFIFRLAGHNTTVGAASGATVLWRRTENGPAGPLAGPGRAGPENSNFLTGRAARPGGARPSSRNLGPARPGPSRFVSSRSCCVSTVEVYASCCLFPLSSDENFRNVSRNIDNTITT
jgi:hypothetical protein